LPISDLESIRCRSFIEKVVSLAILRHLSSNRFRMFSQIARSETRRERRVKDQYAEDVLALRSKALATPVEHGVCFADYREVNGVKLPFRLRRAIGTDTTEETTFDRYQINPRIAPQKFAVTK
jgi:hypothetical protein